MTKDMNLRDTGIVLSWLSGLLAALMSSLAGIWGKTGLAALFGENVFLPCLMGSGLFRFVWESC